MSAANSRSILAFTRGQESLAELYERYAVDAIRLAHVILGDRQAAEDTVQDAFVRMAGRLRHIRDRDAFPRYLRRTVVNLCRMRIRRARLERALTTFARDPSVASHEAAISEREAIRSAIGKLSERQRIAIALRYYDDMSDEEIAEVLSCRRSTVRSLISRAIPRLREEIGDDQD